MNKCESFLAPLAAGFIKFRKACGCWNEACYGSNLRRFRHYCTENYPDATTLTQEMVDGWCGKRETESNNSCRARISVVAVFVEYLRGRGLTEAIKPLIPLKQNRKYIPHAFSPQELENFFRACDEIEAPVDALAKIGKKLTVPVFFRLLYSTGIRTNEARQLKKSDVDLTHGVLHIDVSKGNNQRFVVLHDSMLEIMLQYDSAMTARCPGREYFFPSPMGGSYQTTWVGNVFDEMWTKYNTAHATPYDLRHNYAVENINKWVGYGFDFFDKLVALSKSMGHAGVEGTKYYFHLVPALADVIEEVSGESFDDLVPEVDYAAF
jgi:integrase